MRTAEETAANFYAMTNDLAVAMFANGRDRLDCALETVERVMSACGY